MRRRRLEQLTGEEILARDILSADFQTILPAGAVLKREYIEKLKELEIREVYVQDDGPEEEIAILKEDIENHIREKVKDILEKHTYRHNEELAELSEAADNIITTIVEEEEEVVEQVYDIRERNADIYEHSLSICTMAVLTALKMKMEQKMVHDIGVGCLLHDIGLRYLVIPYQNEELETLSEQDMAEFKKHPVYGYHALNKENWISETVKNLILYHHERLDGSGFPLRATHLSPAVRIINICDAFDEMICGIGCKKVKVHEAIEYLKYFKNSKFDGAIVDTFLQFIAVYPVGTRVITNEGEEAVVIRQNREFPDRPVLKITKDKNGNEITGDVIADLIKAHTTFIEKVLD